MQLPALFAALALLGACSVAPDPNDHVTQVAEVSVASFHSEHAPSFHIVDEASTYMQRLYDRVAVDRPPDVEAAEDAVYLIATTTDALERFAASDPTLTVPAGEQLVYGQLHDGRWRTYLVGPVVLDSNDIRAVAPGHDALLARTVIDLEFTDAGARRLGDVTSRIVGHKLAIVVDGHVVAAPVIRSPIQGRHAVITLDLG
jgi:preprotein translocase subunit SecD